MPNTKQVGHHHRKHLEALTRSVSKFIEAIDAHVVGDGVAHEYTAEDGRKLGALINELDVANDRAREFGLGEALTPLQKEKP